MIIRQVLLNEFLTRHELVSATPFVCWLLRLLR
jgi:hypothetical protein